MVVLAALLGISFGENGEWLKSKGLIFFVKKNLIRFKKTLKNVFLIHTVAEEVPNGQIQTDPSTESI